MKMLENYSVEKIKWTKSGMGWEREQSEENKIHTSLNEKLERKKIM